MQPQMIDIDEAIQIVISPAVNYSDRYSIFHRSETDGAGIVIVIDRLDGKAYSTEYFVDSDDGISFRHVVAREGNQFVLFRRARNLSAPTMNRI